MQTTEQLSKTVVVRDLIIFCIKLWMDGLKDVVTLPLAGLAAAFDVLKGPNSKGFRMYRVMRRAERFDLWLNLYGATQAAEHSAEGLFGGSEPGDGSMVGDLEALDQRRRSSRSAQRIEREPHGA